MELSITRTKAALLVVGAAAFGWYHASGGRVPEVPPEVREVLPSPPAPPAPASRDGPAAAPPATRPPAAEEEEAAPAPRASGSPHAAGSEETAPKKPERTPDEQARSKVGLAESYAENGRYDRALEVLDEAEALGPTDAVKAEIEAARARVTALMRARR